MAETRDGGLQGNLASPREILISRQESLVGFGGIRDVIKGNERLGRWKNQAYVYYSQMQAHIVQLNPVSSGQSMSHLMQRKANIVPKASRENSCRAH